MLLGPARPQLCFGNCDSATHAPVLIWCGNTALIEATDQEAKAAFSNSTRDRLELVKVLVSMANTSGGEVHIATYSCDARELDSARLDDLVNSCVAPRVGEISSDVRESNAIIYVKQSTSRSHVFTHTKSYDDGGRQKTAFHAGQVVARHSSKTEPATGDDLNTMLQARLARLLEKMSDMFAKLAFDVGSGNGAVAVAISDRHQPLTISVPDLNKTHPWNATKIGRELGKSQSWVAVAAQVLALKGDRKYCSIINGGQGHPAFVMYSDAALAEIRRRLRSDPMFNPFEEQKRRKVSIKSAVS